MSHDDPPERVHQQSNGARIISSPSSASPDPAWDDDDLPPLKTSRSAGAFGVRGNSSSIQQPLFALPSLEAWGPALGLGLFATVVCSIVYNAIDLMTWPSSYRFLALASGAAIGFAVRAGEPPDTSGMRRAVAAFFTYVCVASTYPVWFYDYEVHPEAYEIDEAKMAASIDEDGWASAFTVDYADLMKDRVERPFDPEAALVAVADAVILPVTLLKGFAVWDIVLLFLALGTAWKTAGK